MENLSRNLGKTVKTYTPPKKSRNACSWNVLLLDDHGRIISLGKLKNLTITLAILLVMIAASLAYFFILLKTTKHDNKILSNSLKNANLKNASLVDEKDLLMVRLVMAESRIKKPVEKPSEKVPVVETATIPEDTVKKTSLTEKVESREEKDFIQKIDIKNFTVIYEPDTSIFKIHFKMINITKKHTRVSGYAFVILKSNKIDQDTWVAFPDTPLISGKPSMFKKGHYFSISYFKEINLKAEKKLDPKQLKGATVLAFNAKGELLLKKSFPIEITGSVSS